MRTIRMLAALAAAVFCSVPAAAEDRGVAYVEEITYGPDGAEHVERYRPNERPVQVPAPAPQPRQRELNDAEKQELAQLESDFAHGDITESEYNSRKMSLYRGTFVGGYNEDDGLLNYSGQF